MIKLPSDIDPITLINDLRTISWEAAEILLCYSKSLKDSNYKSNILKNNNNDDPVTLADLKVNKLIIKRIHDKYKNIDWEILSEENAKINPQSCNSQAEWLWVLDPLDGTKDFIQGTKDYAMHLALNFNKKPYIGIVLIPERDELWFAFGEKVWVEKKNGSNLMINAFPNKSLQQMVLVSSKNHSNHKLNKLINKINFKKVIRMGSIGCKLTSIVRGECDIYICLSLPGQSSPKDWDFAAPEAILRAAGGAITNLENKELTYSKPNFEQEGIIIASNNKHSHRKICLEIKKVIKDYNLYPLE